MSKVEYLIVFIGIILGFSVSEYLKGISFLIKHRSTIKFYRPLVLWQILILLIMIQWWWSAWLYRSQIEVSLLNYLIVMLIPMIYYLMVALIFPTPRDLSDYDNDMQSFFYSNSRYFYVAVILLFIVYEFTGIAFFKEPWTSEKVVTRSIVIFSCLLNIIKNNSLFERINLATIYFVIFYFTVIRS